MGQAQLPAAKLLTALAASVALDFVVSPCKPLAISYPLVEVRVPGPAKRGQMVRRVRSHDQRLRHVLEIETSGSVAQEVSLERMVVSIRPMADPADEFLLPFGVHSRVPLLVCVQVRQPSGGVNAKGAMVNSTASTTMRLRMRSLGVAAVAVRGWCSCRGRASRRRSTINLFRDHGDHRRRGGVGR